jgi:hypothetical protein
MFSSVARRSAVSFWDVLRPASAGKSKGSPKPPTAAELEAALAEAEAEATRAEAAAAEAAQRRAEQLLTADEPTLDRVDRELQLAQRAADKAALAVEALRQKLVEAREAERQAGLDAIHREGEAALAAGLAAYARYGELAAEVATLAEAMADNCDLIEAANRKLVAAADARRVADLDLTARPEVSAVRQFRVALWHQLRLPSTTGPHDFVWPAISETRIPPPAARPAPPVAPPADDSFSFVPSVLTNQQRPK